jgi:addiction module HigA family antidote
MTAPHPGEYLASTYTAPLGLSASQLAGLLDVPEGTINRLLWLDGPMSADLAVRLESLFEKPAVEWMMLQVRYDIERAWAHEEIGKVSRYPEMNRLWLRGFPTFAGQYRWRENTGAQDYAVELMFETYGGITAPLVRCYETRRFSIDDYAAGEWRCI